MGKDLDLEMIFEKDHFWNAKIKHFFSQMLRSRSFLKDNDLPVSPYGRDPSDDDYWELLTINAIENIPKDKLIQMIEWAFQKLDERSYGWPDLLITKNGEYRFIEIKSPTDALHLTQYQWFKWALDNEINCELCNISTNIA